jgi:aspartyl/asparaginyl beta-hydroxylase (cupin superfamily)
MLPVHTNYDPHMYRCHMGVRVPQGDIGIRVSGETRNWIERKFLVFDSMQPHTVWNFTNEARYVLDVDCFRPEPLRQDVLTVYRALMDARMSESSLTLGLSGGRAEMNREDKIKFASHHEPVA